MPDLIFHVPHHAGELRFKCETCGHRSKRLKGHTRLQNHTGERTFACGICHKRFKRNDVLRRHEDIHTGNRPFKCGTCEKCFRRKGDLQSHERIHTGVRPYGCQYCIFRSNCKRSVKCHEKTRHPDLPVDVEYISESSSTANDVALRKTLNTSSSIEASARSSGNTIAQYDLSMYQEEYQRSGPKTTSSNTYGIREQPSSACTRVSAQHQHPLPSIHELGLLECRMPEAE
ncbi:hypothetical protein BDP55DRAFT_678598 [Colletotrichum godetiae]|uniref:C2H2-type domain-containing protein n=1 Tax=Colletotrichum godetiae TaxID=1209918 RepID=A0AAJ0AAZ9_9PEZI|nr:uncharacterized protein BDP55DRAFT_678598 [Colletotrichum godetiae]KAK1659825.1 hypothetical protein BDP55DRAFT_678598 [Colletotrichum godetiae]